MSNPLTMFHEKSDPSAPWSMGRVIAFMTAITVNVSLILYARGKAPINWPFGVVILFTYCAMPLLRVFTSIPKWIDNKPFRDAASALVARIPSMILGGVAGNTTIKTEVATGGEK